MFCANSWFPNTSSQIMKEHKGEAIWRVPVNTTGLLSISYVPKKHDNMIYDIWYVKSKVNRKYSCLFTLLPLNETETLANAKQWTFQWLPEQFMNRDCSSFVQICFFISRLATQTRLHSDVISLWHQITFRWHVKLKCQENQQNIIQNFDHDPGSPIKIASAPRWNN